MNKRTILLYILCLIYCYQRIKNKKTDKKQSKYYWAVLTLALFFYWLFFIILPFCFRH